jgi:hypothetical protein
MYDDEADVELVEEGDVLRKATHSLNVRDDVSAELDDENLVPVLLYVRQGLLEKADVFHGNPGVEVNEKTHTFWRGSKPGNTRFCYHAMLSCGGGGPSPAPAPTRGLPLLGAFPPIVKPAKGVTRISSLLNHASIPSLLPIERES